jgi:hypothetical protein
MNDHRGFYVGGGEINLGDAYLYTDTTMAFPLARDRNGFPVDARDVWNAFSKLDETEKASVMRRWQNETDSLVALSRARRVYLTRFDYSFFKRGMDATSVPPTLRAIVEPRFRAFARANPERPNPISRLIYMDAATYFRARDVHNTELVRAAKTYFSTSLARLVRYPSAPLVFSSANEHALHLFSELPRVLQQHAKKYADRMHSLQIQEVLGSYTAVIQVRTEERMR